VTSDTVPAGGYLDRARDAGLVHEIAGRTAVVGIFADTVGGERQGLIEYCDPQLLGDNARTLAAAVTAAFPAVDVLVLRTSDECELEPPWQAHLTYVRHEPASVTEPAAPADGLTVRPAEARDDLKILDWLVRAFEAYGEEQAHHGEPDEVRDKARTVLAAPDRYSYVALADGVPIGHVTTLSEADDDVTGRLYVELLDILVDADPPTRSAATAALQDAAVRHAARLGRPLIGHVVHSTRDDSKARAIVKALRGRGWTVDHRYWRLAPAEGLSDVAADAGAVAGSGRSSSERADPSGTGRP
jgi:hypothetical protein